jgi:hypothetical protein
MKAREERINKLANKFIRNRSDQEIERRVKKCPNKFYWDIAELELARRTGEEYSAFFQF